MRKVLSLVILAVAGCTVEATTPPASGTLVETVNVNDVNCPNGVEIISWVDRNNSGVRDNGEATNTTRICNNTIESQFSLTVSPQSSNDVNQFTSLQAALDSLANKRIAANADVIINVLAGTYQHNKTLKLNHPDSKNIFIETQTSSAVILDFTNLGSGPGASIDANAAILVTGGEVFGFLGGMVVRAPQDRTEPLTGIVVQDSSGVYLGDIQFEGFQKGINIRSNSFAESFFGLQVICGAGALTTGILVEESSSAKLPISFVGNCNFGIWAANNSKLQVNGTTILIGIADGVVPSFAGFLADTGAELQAHNTVVTETSFDRGYIADNGALLVAHNIAPEAKVVVQNGGQIRFAGDENTEDIPFRTTCDTTVACDSTAIVLGCTVGPSCASTATTAAVQSVINL